MPLRIAIDVRRVRGFGIGTYIRNLTHALARLDRVNQYFLVAPQADYPHFAGLAPNFHVLAYERAEAGFVEQCGFSMFLRKLSVHLFHIPSNTVPLFMPRPYVVTIHDLGSLFFERRRGFQNSLWLYRLRRGLLRADKVIAVSEATRRDVENLLGVPPGRIRRIYSAPDPRFRAHPSITAAPATDPDTECVERRRILERYQISYPFVLYAGNIRPQKNIPRLVEAFSVLRADLKSHPFYQNLRLIIIGDEISRYPAVRQAVIQAGVEHVVRFLGFIPVDALRVFFASAAVFAFPSLYEGFGLPPLEAMSTGTPVVASNAGSLEEAVGDAAMLVNPENVFDIARGIREVLLDEQLRCRLIARGYERVSRQFNWERTAAEVLSIYEEVARARLPRTWHPP
jgi:glycosyltransferase involved in cell wall biosynthesis